MPLCELGWHPSRLMNTCDIPAPVPALVHPSAFDGHMHIVGPSQTGKTSIAVAGIVTQAIRGYWQPVLDISGAERVGLDGDALLRRSDTVPIFIIDLKGDQVLFNTVREECERRGQRCHFFTLQQGKATSYFNPLANLSCGPRPVIEYCEIILYMLDLFHGFFYGGGYYSEQSRNLLLKALKQMPSPPASWEELYQHLLDTLDRREHRDVFELVGRIYAIAQYPALGPAPAGYDAIEMKEVIENNECVYFWLPALESSMSAIEVAKMALFCFLDAARKWNTGGRGVKRPWVFLDEAQVIIGPNIERVFQQASGAKLRLVLSNQSLSNLDSRDAPHFSRTVWVNTRLKLTFGLVDHFERQAWMDLSSEEFGVIPGDTRDQTIVRPSLDRNIINGMMNTEGASLLYVRGDAGRTSLGCEPRQIWCPYPMSERDYRRREDTPWPDEPQRLDRDGESVSTVVNEEAPQQVEARAIERYAALEALFDKAATRSGRQPRSAAEE